MRQNQKRILTRLDRLSHIAQVKARDDKDRKGEYWELIGDSATLNSNQYHEPATGFNEFYPDTPLWISQMAVRRGWASAAILFGDERNARIVAGGAA